jgi:uncharacterized radical SAM protein YgiQ
LLLPVTKEEIVKLGWDRPDIILVSGDTYIDSPFIGIAVIGNWLMLHGFKVAVIAQPDVNTSEIAALGEPKLFWGVSAGAVDSLISNYTPTMKFRNSDDLTPGGINNLRPDRASMVYVNLIRKHFKNTVPIVLGGIEASLRRVAHFDLKDNALRRSILFDAKADVLVYGMGEKTILELATALKNKQAWNNINGLCYISKTPVDGFTELPSFENCKENPDEFSKMFNTFYHSKNGLIQKHDSRYLVHNPPQATLTQAELDKIAAMNFTREAHPHYLKKGVIKAQDTIKFSIISHRGCFGECNFCAISVHQGRTVVSRSVKSIKAEADYLAEFKDFKGYITDIGGPTANMYAVECAVFGSTGNCKDKRCLFPEACENLVFAHDKQLNMFNEVLKNPKIKKVFIASGIRYDMVCADKKFGQNYINAVTDKHTSGQLKIAPEHIDDKILTLMGKPCNKTLIEFIEMFKKARSNVFLTYYFIAAYPGCTETEMKNLKKFASSKLKIRPEQVQIFTPSPSTYATLMYYTKLDLAGNVIKVETDRGKKQKQKERLINKPLF